MLVALRREYANLITSGGQVFLLGAGQAIGTATGWLVCSSLIAAFSLIAWISTWRRARAFDDTPTSRVASAAQGYVELQGRGVALQGLPVLGPLTQRPCLWYRYVIERKNSDNEWRRESSGESDDSFLLDDGSGECLIDPVGAEILPDDKRCWTEGDHRYTEWLLLGNAPLYALGDFRTIGSADLQLDRDADVKALLADWKKDPVTLLKRFDLDGNGQIDLREWELARAQAVRDVDRMHREARQQPDLHTMRRPAGGQLYIISSQPPERVSRRYRLWSFAHLACFFGALWGVWTLLRTPGPHG